MLEDGAAGLRSVSKSREFGLCPERYRHEFLIGKALPSTDKAWICSRSPRADDG
jgi:hypothetical protein